MRSTIAFALIAATSAVVFHNTSPPTCHVDSAGRTVVFYSNSHPEHKSFLCTHSKKACTCTRHPSHHHGECRQFDHSTGKRLSISGECVDQCKGVSCGNGVCQDGKNTYTCKCNSGWTGQHCETSLNSCRYKHVHPGCDSRKGYCSNPTGSACIIGCMARGGCTPHGKYSVKMNNCRRKCSRNPCKHSC